MYIGEPHNVAAIVPPSKKRAKPKSASFNTNSVASGFGLPVGFDNNKFCGFKSLNYKSNLESNKSFEKNSINYVIITIQNLQLPQTY